LNLLKAIAQSPSKNIFKRKININQKDASGWILSLAVKLQQTGIATYLLLENANPNVIDPDGSRLLIEAFKVRIFKWPSYWCKVITPKLI
jgi:hypothetical protein